MGVIPSELEMELTLSMGEQAMISFMEKEIMILLMLVMGMIPSMDMGCTTAVSQITIL